jgi:hypothetical protein
VSPRYKKPRPFQRDKETLRDASLLVIATEDSRLPVEYFDLFHNPRVKVLVLPTEEGLSAPKHVMERLAAFNNEHQLDEADQLWLMLDTDHWTKDAHIAGFSTVCADAIQLGARMAHSNPCFELWLLLHLTELNANEQFANYEEVRDRIMSLIGSCSKRTLDAANYTLASAALAVQRAEKLDRNPGQRWPEKTGTHVYKIVKRLLA